MDEADEIVVVWHRRRPGSTTFPVGAWLRIHRLAVLLNGGCKRCLAEYGLEIQEFDVLAALRHTGRPYRLSPGRLLQ